MRISDWSSDVCSSDLRLATYHAPCQFVVTQDQRKARAALVRFLELTLETAATGVHQQAQPWQHIAQALGQSQCCQLGRLTECADIGMRRRAQGVDRKSTRLNSSH